MLVAAVIIQDDVDQLAGRDFALQAVEEAQELLASVITPPVGMDVFVLQSVPAP